MTTVNIHEAEAHLSCLIDDAVKGEPPSIAMACQPLSRVTRLAAANTARWLKAPAILAFYRGPPQRT